MATALMTLMKLKGVGRRGALKMVSPSDGELDAVAFREAISSRARALPGASHTALDIADAWTRSEKELDRGSKVGVRAFALHDAAYPTRLKDIPDPPAVLFAKGNTDALNAPCSIAIIGTREPTSYGMEVARRGGRTASEASFTVVSGLAHGCDTYAHEGCVEVEGVGVAVLAHGLDHVYPAASRGLAAKLLELNGCLASEYPFGMKPARTAFAERDRIQSGLSDGVFVIETDVEGGTMHTVRFARAQHRRVACTAHPQKWLFEEKTRGNQKLIADRWAEPIPDGQALSDFLSHIGLPSPAREAQPVADSRVEIQQSFSF